MKRPPIPELDGVRGLAIVQVLLAFNVRSVTLTGMTQYKFTSDAVLTVLASDAYRLEDHIGDLDEYLKEARSRSQNDAVP